MSVGDSPHVVVVGGGITGLTAAYRLAGAAQDGRVRVTLLEASDRLGGKVRTDRSQGLVVEEGPDSFLALAYKPWARDLCRELGLGEELYATPPANRRSYIYHQGRLHPLPAGVATGMPSRLGPFLRTGLLSPAGKARALADLVLPRILPPSGEDVAVGRLLRARLGSELVDRLVEPLMAGVYAGNIDELSVDAVSPALREQEKARRSLILATMAEARAARRRTAPGAEAPPAFLSLRHGLTGLIEALAQRLKVAPGVEVRTGVAVRGLARGLAGDYTLRLDRGVMAAERVVVAVPAPVAATLLAELAPDAARELAAVSYADVALAVLAYGQENVGRIPRGSGFLVPRGEDIEASACTWLSAKWPDSAPAGTLLLRVYLGRAGDGVLAYDDATLLKTARVAVARSMGIDAAPSLARVVRLPGALPQYTVGHLARLGRVEAALRTLPGLVVTGSAFRGVGLPDCVRQGGEAAETVLTSLPPADATPAAGPDGAGPKAATTR